MTEHLTWFKSSYSDFEDASCVEVATCPRAVLVRDATWGDVTRRPSLPAGHLTVPRTAA
ncbi:DUF397 domain-containing protein [Streptomyces niveus]|uniref:DUF397 domain-containing protein n=1 Tax=Streptomyces niveus TaxID=193462 RepID=UPI002E3591B0|nr:DUF397 domain-containing protein [Streptomyces niveus]